MFCITGFHHWGVNKPLKRWFGYFALVVAVFGIWFGAVHRAQPVHSNNTWVANLSQGHSSASIQGVASTSQTATANKSFSSVESTKGSNDNGPIRTSSPSTNPSTTTRTQGVTTQSPRTQTTTAHATTLHTATAQSTTTHKAGTGQTAASSQTTAVAPLTGKSSQAPPASTKLGTFTILVTLNHGAVPKADEIVPIVKGESLLWYMRKYFTITTIYNGDFIVSIDGIKSQWTGVPAAQRKPVDWFLYVNNQKAPVGLADIVPKAGDVDVWDYHSWNPSTGQG